MRSDAKINWGELLSAGTAYYQQGNATKQVERLLAEYDTIDLYDVFLHQDEGGRYVIEELERLADDNYASSGNYRFKVLKNHDEKGKPCPVVLGEDYYLHVGTVERYRDPKNGRVVPMTTRQMRAMKRRNRVRGDEHDIDKWLKLKIDDDGCVTVNFRSACNIIVNRTDLSIYDDKFVHFEPYYENEHEKKKRTRRKRVEESPIAENPPIETSPEVEQQFQE